MKLLSIVFFSALMLYSCDKNAQTSISTNKRIVPGAEQVHEYLPLLQNKSVALVVNQTSLIQQTHLVDSLISANINVAKVFSPEHGYKGVEDAGTKIKNQRLENSNLEVISLYGKKFKPSSNDLQNIDLIVFDIQDVGVRFYTYISTLHYVMEAAAENNIPLILLDRPNPLAHYIDGPIREEALKSFVGMHPVPIVYGMTIGEYARMINGEAWLANGIKARLKIVKVANYDHNSQYILPIPPSPNLPNNVAIGHYPSLCLFEGTTISVGRGTSKPFQMFGHPKMSLSNFKFTPKSKIGATKPKHENIICQGKDLSQVAPSKKGLNLSYLLEAYADLKSRQLDYFNDNNFFDLLAGTEELKKMIEAGEDEETIKRSWKQGIVEFKETRSKYLLYN